MLFNSGQKNGNQFPFGRTSFETWLQKNAKKFNTKKINENKRKFPQK